jgi:hypothetical protein
VPGKSEVGELGERDVDGEGEVFGDVFGCGEDGAEEAAGEEAVQTGFLGEGDKLIGRDQTALRMLPSREGFEAAEKPGSKLHKRLKIRDDLVIFKRSPQIVCVFGSHG